MGDHMGIWLGWLCMVYTMRVLFGWSCSLGPTRHTPMHGKRERKASKGLLLASCMDDTMVEHPRVRCTRAEKGSVPNGSISLETLINMYCPAKRSISWTFWHPNILLSWAYSLPLISLAWLTNQSEFEWSQVYLLVSLHLVGTWVSIGCGILVTLGGCRHLDGLEAAKE
jgi:hypothetical protein